MSQHTPTSVVDTGLHQTQLPKSEDGMQQSIIKGFVYFVNSSLNVSGYTVALNPCIPLLLLRSTGMRNSS
jgi:hypothetical protein